MTKKSLDRVEEDGLSSQRKTAWQMIRAFVPAFIAFLFYISLFIAFAWFMAKFEREHEARKKKCDTQCVAIGYHGGELANDNCICESRQILQGE
jgi:hypothetical protein